MKNFERGSQEIGLSATQRLVAADPSDFIKPVAEVLNKFDLVSSAPAANLTHAPVAPALAG